LKGFFIITFFANGRTMIINKNIIMTM